MIDSIKPNRPRVITHTVTIGFAQIHFRCYDGYQMQINLVSREDLLAARANPELYGDLIVRVGGFSDYYVRLAESLQLEILSRTEHVL